MTQVFRFGNVGGWGALGRDFPLETLLSETTGSLCPDL